MAKHEQPRWRYVLETYPCETCGAPPGEPCHTYSGRVKHDATHADRTYQAQANGWRESESDEPRASQ